MSVYLNFRSMRELTRGLASIDVYHHFLAIECGQATMEAGDDYFCDAHAVITHRHQYARTRSAAVTFSPFQLQSAHADAHDAMLLFANASPSKRHHGLYFSEYKIRNDKLRNVAEQHSNKHGARLSDVDIYRACATYLKLDDADYDIEKMRAERKRLFDLWTAGVEIPVPETRNYYPVATKCDDPDCGNWADATGFCSVHRGHYKKQKVEKEEKADEKGLVTGAPLP
jgi:hypothetical protein